MPRDSSFCIKPEETMPGSHHYSRVNWGQGEQGEVPVRSAALEGSIGKSVSSKNQQHSEKWEVDW